MRELIVKKRKKSLVAPNYQKSFTELGNLEARKKKLAQPPQLKIFPKKVPGF